MIRPYPSPCKLATVVMLIGIVNIVVVLVFVFVLLILSFVKVGDHNSWWNKGDYIYYTGSQRPPNGSDGVYGFMVVHIIFFIISLLSNGLLIYASRKVKNSKNFACAWVTFTLCWLPYAVFTATRAILAGNYLAIIMCPWILKQIYFIWIVYIFMQDIDEAKDTQTEESAVPYSNNAVVSYSVLQFGDTEELPPFMTNEYAPPVGTPFKTYGYGSPSINYRYNISPKPANPLSTNHLPAVQQIALNPVLATPNEMKSRNPAVFAPLDPPTQNKSVVDPAARHWLNPVLPPPNQKSQDIHTVGYNLSPNWVPAAQRKAERAAARALKLNPVLPPLIQRNSDDTITGNSLNPIVIVSNHGTLEGDVAPIASSNPALVPSTTERKSGSTASAASSFGSNLSLVPSTTERRSGSDAAAAASFSSNSDLVSSTQRNSSGAAEESNHLNVDSSTRKKSDSSAHNVE